MDIKRLSRRSFWVTLWCALVYLLYRVAIEEEWIIVTRGKRAYDKGIAPTTLRPHEEISLLAVGDTGLPSPQRVSVISAMKQLTADWSTDAALILGDNFYEKGVQSVSDPRFQSDFEQLFDKEHFDHPFYAILGNHDYDGNPQAQVDYTNHSDRWRMPNRYYKVGLVSEQTSLDLFLLDTNPIHDGETEADQQLQWLDRELAKSAADWKMVAGHHPCLSGGEHGRSELVYKGLAPLLSQHHVALYLSGHDHDLQFLDSGDGWHQLISGSGSKLRSTSWIAETKYAAAKGGFAWILVRNQQLIVSIYDERERLFSERLSRRSIDKSTSLRQEPRDFVTATRTLATSTSNGAASDLIMNATTSAALK